jgi:hypothetical protein
MLMTALVMSSLMLLVGAIGAIVASGDMKAVAAAIALNGAYIFPCALIALGARRDRRGAVRT